AARNALLAVVGHRYPAEPTLDLVPRRSAGVAPGDVGVPLTVGTGTEGQEGEVVAGTIGCRFWRERHRVDLLRRAEGRAVVLADDRVDVDVAVRGRALPHDAQQAAGPSGAEAVVQPRFVERPREVAG